MHTVTIEAEMYAEARFADITNIYKKKIQFSTKFLNIYM